MICHKIPADFSRIQKLFILVIHFILSTEIYTRYGKSIQNSLDNHMPNDIFVTAQPQPQPNLTSTQVLGVTK